MNKARFSFSSSKADFYFNARFSALSSLVEKKRTILLTDKNVFKYHKQKFAGWQTIVIKAGEKHKVQSTVDGVVGKLIEMKVDRTWTIIGVGGGVVTDLAGYIAAIFLRGIKVGFVPTTLLAMVDAAIGGKNGIDVGAYKNMVGTIRQPQFILYDVSLLRSLPQKEWKNGFAEIIKHASIGSTKMFRELQKNDLKFYQENGEAISSLIIQNAKLKIRVVQQDEFETGNRKLLNFGHTLAHAIENNYALMHGQSVAIGMVAAAHFSEKLLGFKKSIELRSLIKKYGLPAQMSFDVNKVFDVMVNDKKRSGSEIDYILLREIGEAVIFKVPIIKLKKMIGTINKS